MKKQNIEDIFSSMEDFSSVPPPELWSQIEEKLDKPKKKKRAILWWSAAACLLLGLMLPSILHFSSNSGIKNINNGSGTLPNNTIVSEDKKKDLNNSRTTQKNNVENNKTNNNSIVSKESSSKNIKKSSNDSENQETVIAHADSQTTNKTSITPVKVNTGKNIPNQAVAQQKTYVLGQENSFNSNSKYKVSKTQKTATDKILAEKTFNAGTTNRFSSKSKNQLSNSIFEEQLSSNNNNNNNNVVINSPFPTLNSSQNTLNNTISTPRNEVIKSEKNNANNLADNSKFKNSESKLDSVQLAELQNLEKGITKPDSKKDKEIKPVSNSEKWALEVFAGVASSQNYKNDKTLGYTNDSKQSNTYGVKTKYKINKKWAVGSGFKINELGQSIANVSYINSQYSASLAPSGYYNAEESVAPQQISKNSTYVFVSNNTTNALKSSNIQSDNLQTGNVDQNLKYLEMPFEVSYAVFSKNKASISLNTGGFMGKLISNNVALNGNSIGENANANDFVYGSTLSSTVQYQIYKKTNVFAEPAINYYINPLNNQSFNQFQWGLNFGLNFSF